MILFLAVELLRACHLFSEARTQISYRPITPHSVDSLLFYLREGRHFDIPPLAVQWVTTRRSRVPGGAGTGTDCR